MTFEPFATDEVSATLVRKLEFLQDVERLKEILRRNYVLSGVRRENVAEHSWHVSLMSVLFFEDAADNSVDLLRVLKMLLVHDLVEVDAGYLRF
jgi:putative hydrolase of HD superfamily